MVWVSLLKQLGCKEGEKEWKREDNRTPSCFKQEPNGSPPRSSTLLGPIRVLSSQGEHLAATVQWSERPE